MGTSRKLTEVQLTNAKTALAQYVDQLKQAGVADKAFKKDPKWRQLNARAKEIGARLKTIAAGEALNVEVARLKEERIAAREAAKNAPPAEEEAPKAKKKAKEPAGEPKGEAKAKPKKEKPAK